MMGNEFNSTYNNCPIDTVMNANKAILIRNHYYNTFALSEPLTSSLPTITDTFVGREDEINELNKLIFDDKQKIIVVTGFSGFGKSELAKHFVLKHINECNILWIQAEDEESIKKSFMGIFNIKENYSNILVKSYCQSLKKRTFIVFDNAPNRKMIRNYELYSTPTSKVHYIITSNNQNWGRLIKVLDLVVLKEHSALQIFKNVMNGEFKHQDLETYKNIAKLTGYVPLTLQVVASYLHQKICALGDTFILQTYSNQLEKSEPNNYAINQMLPDYSSENYEKSFSLALKMIIDDIKNINDKESKLALSILNICAFLYSNKINYIDFLNIPYFKIKIDKKEISENDLKEACYLLRNYSLISINSDKNSFQVHDLIQKTIIIHQNSCSMGKHNIYFFYNLEILLHFNDTAKSHGNFILNPAFKMTYIFRKFVRKYYPQIKTSPILCINIILANGKLYLNEIFNKMGKVYSRDYINRHNLLHQGVEYEQYDVVKLMIKCGANADLKYKSQTALMRAAYNIDLKIIKLLTNKSCQINTVDENNDNVLFCLIFGTNGIRNKYESKEAVEILRLLVDRGADVTARNMWNMSLLHAAAMVLNIDMMKCLIHEYDLNVNGLDLVGRTPIFYISIAQDTDRQRRLMAAKFLVHTGTDLRLKNYYGAEYLYKYYTYRNQDFTNVQDNPRTDELLRTVADGDAMRHLIEEQALQLGQSSKAPHQAVLCKKYQILEFLLDYDVPLDCRWKNNETILHVAAFNINFKAIKILVNRGADITATDTDGWSVLSYLILGVSKNYDKEDEGCEILRWLVKKGADLEHVDDNKSTLVHLSTHVNTLQLLRCLVQEYNLNINAVNTCGTALHNAVLLKSILDSEIWWKTLQSLLDLGACLDITDKYGKTPVEIAKEQNLPDVVNLLTTYVRDHS